MRVLVIDDDPAIREAVRRALSHDGIETASTGDPSQALATALRVKPQRILLDIGLGPVDGRELLKELKARRELAAVPVIFLTSLDSEADKVFGLDLGADDYIAKPFGAFELAARVRAALRRGRRAAGPAGLRRGPLKMDPEARTADIGRRSLSLQPKEFELLLLLASSAGRVLTRAHLIESTSSYGQEVSTRSLDTHIKNLRKKLGSWGTLIETVRNVGYRLS